MIKLIMTEEQAAYLSRALEAFSRTGLGQFKDLFDEIVRYNLSHSLKDELESNLKSILFGLEHNSYLGINSEKVTETVRVAFDAYQHLRRELSWKKSGKNWRKDKRTSDMMQVFYDPVMKVSKLKEDFFIEEECRCQE